MLKNKLIKRVFACVLTTAMVIGALTGCQSSGSASGSSGGGKILFIITDVNDTYRATLANAVVEAGKNQGVTLDMVETGNDVQAQVDLISQAKSKGYSAIILRSADANTAVQMNIASNDLPIVYVNSEPSVDHLRADKYIYVGSDENQPGKLQAYHSQGNAHKCINIDPESDGQQNACDHDPKHRMHGCIGYGPLLHHGKGRLDGIIHVDHQQDRCHGSGHNAAEEIPSARQSDRTDQCKDTGDQNDTEDQFSEGPPRYPIPADPRHPDEKLFSPIPALSVHSHSP